LYDQFLSRLGDVRTYVMDEGKLVLNLWADAGNMVFEKAGQAASSIPSEGLVWRLDAYADAQGNLVDARQDTEITLEFQAGQLGGSAGCNRYFAPYQLDGARLAVGPIGATQMACQAAVNEQERLYLAALESAASYEITESQLRLVDATGKTVLTFSEAKPTSLTGTTWTLIAYHDGKSALVSALAGTEITARFGGDGKLSGSAGCNNYTALYELDGDAVTLGPIAATRKMCATPDGAMEQESAYLAVLESAHTYRIKVDTLELIDANGVRVATFAAGAR
jgi:heat shock protein HslJ